MFAGDEGPDQTANAQADLSLRFLNMPEDTFSHDEAHTKFSYLLTLRNHVRSATLWNARWLYTLVHNTLS